MIRIASGFQMESVAGSRRPRWSKPPHRQRSQAVGGAAALLLALPLRALMFQAGIKTNGAAKRVIGSPAAP